VQVRAAGSVGQGPKNQFLPSGRDGVRGGVHYWVMPAPKTMDVVITWAPKANATLLTWIDDKEFIHPSPKSVFVGRGKIEFTYPCNDRDDFHVFEWTLAFPDRKLHDIVVRASWDGETWHTVGAQKNDKEHTWTSFGVAP
jgi:hypothetical protein